MSFVKLFNHSRVSLMVIHEEKNKNMTNKSFKMTTAKPFS